MELIATTPTGTEFKIWGRDSGIHFDCTVDAVLPYDENNADHVKYHRHKEHPADQDACDTCCNTLKTKIEAGEDL